MKTLRSLALTLLAALCLLSPLIPARTFADAIVQKEQNGEKLIEQIRDTYKKAKKPRASRRSRASAAST